MKHFHRRSWIIIFTFIGTVFSVKAESDHAQVTSINGSIKGNTTACINSKPNPRVTFSGSAGTSPYTFTYQINGGSSKTITTQNLKDTVSIEVQTSIADTLKFKLLKINDKNNVTVNVIDSAVVKITALPDLSFNTSAETSVVNGVSFFKVCSNTNIELTFTNISATKTSNATYLIDWGDGSEVFQTTNWSSVSHLYATGLWKMRYSINSVSGCSNSKTFDIYVGSNPAVSLGSPGNTDNCSNTPLTFPITGTENNPPGTTYTVKFNDGTPAQVFNHPPPTSVTHEFTSTSCGVTSISGTNSYPNSFSASIVASNMCGVSEVNVVPIYVSTSPVVNFTIPKSAVGTNNTICLTNTTTGYVNEGANCKIVPKLVWTITPSTGFTLVNGSLGDDFNQNNSNLWIKGSDIICPMFTVPGIYKIRLRVDTKRCGNDMLEKTICVEAPLKPQFIVDSNSGCSPLEVQTTNITDLNSTCSSTSKWTVTYAESNCGKAPATWSFTNGTNDMSSSPTLKFETPGIYTLQLSLTNSAGTFNTSQTIEVKAPPTATIKTIPDFCGIASFNPEAIINSCTSGSDTLSYEWEFTGGNPDKSYNLNPGIINYSKLGSYSVTLKVTNSCGTTIVESNHFNVNPIPLVDVISNRITTNGQLTESIVFTGSDSAEFYWVNDNSNIGLDKSGKGNISPFTATNNSDTIQTAHIIVTPKFNSTSCTGVQKTFTITVNPSGDLNQPVNIIVSNDSTTKPIVFTSNKTGGETSFHWTNDNISTGLQSSGEGTINSFIAKNNSTTPIVSRITVLPKFENEGVENTGLPKTFTITVLPTAQINPIENIELCNGVKTSDFNFTTNNSVGITTFSWTNSNAEIGLAADGSGNISGFHVQNPDSTQIQAIITITPQYTFENVSNSGNPVTFTIKVNPGAVITSQPVSSYICPGGIAKSLKVEYTNGAGIPTYQWFSNKSNSNSGGKLIPNATSDTFIPPTDFPGTTYYYCVISLPSGICANVISEVATVSVNDAAIITEQPASLQNICVGGTVSAPLSLKFTGGSGTSEYQWFFNSTNTKAGARGIKGANDSTYLPPVFSTVGSYFYFVEITHSGDGCGSVTSDIAEIKVVSDPIIDFQPLPTQTVCQQSAPTDLIVRAFGGLGVYTYQWFANTVNNNFSGTEIPGAVFNSFKPSTELTGTMYYYCEVTQPNGPNCSVKSNTATLMVNANPVITSQPTSRTVCLYDDIDSLSVSYLYGSEYANYQWYSNSVNSNQNGNIIPNATQNTFKPLASEKGTKFYYCVISFPYGGFTTIVSDVAAITVNPIPQIQSKTILVCSGSDIILTPDNTGLDIVPIGTLYIWSTPDVYPVNSVTGISSQSQPANVFNQTLVNTTDSVATVTYKLAPISGTCSGDSFNIIVKVVPTIKINAVINNSTCFGIGNGSITTNIKGGLPFDSQNKYTITWNGPNGFIASTCDITNLKPGNYTITVNDAGGCPISELYTITEPDEITISLDNKMNVDCNNNKNGKIAISVTGGVPPYSFNWMIHNQPFASTEDIENLAPGIYTIMVSDANRCNSKTASYSISGPDSITINIKDQNNISCFGDNTGSVSVIATGGTPVEISPGNLGYNYSWSGPNQFISDKNTITNLIAGIYNLTVTDKNGCNQTLQIHIQQPDELIIETNVHPVTCYGSKDASINLNITGGIKPYNIVWSNFGKGITQENLSPGEYFITITDANNCQQTAYVNIPEANFAIRPMTKNVSCYGANDGSIDLNVSGGLNPISLVWADNPTAGSTRNHLGPGIYTVTLHDGAPCNISESFLITEPQQIIITGKVTNAFDCDISGSGGIDITVKGGTQPYTFKWSNGSTTEDISGVQPGMYYVIITDSNGCNNMADFEIFRPAPLTISVTSKTDYDCGSSKLKMANKAIISGGFSPYHVIWSRGSVSGTLNEIMETTQNGVVTLTVTDSMGCAISTMFDVNLPTINIEYSLIDCNKFNYQFTAHDTKVDALNYTYLWNFGDGEVSTMINPQHNYQKSGIYKVQLDISNGVCGAHLEEQLFVDQMSSIKLDNEPKFCEGDSTILHISGANSYLWSNGNTGDSIVIKQKGNYSVIGTSIKGCKDTLYFNASNFENFNYTIQSEKNEIIPNGSSTRLWSEYISYSDYRWDFGDGTSGTGYEVNHVFEVNKNGYFDIKLKVINPNGCTENATKRIWITIPDLPNTFSPNSDGINDYFLPGWDLKVYNRNGLTLYQGNEGWDGNYRGQPVLSDFYYFVVYYHSESGTKSKTGYVRVIR
jgi:gliding motility-associated-like protein